MYSRSDAVPWSRLTKERNLLQSVGEQSFAIKWARSPDQAASNPGCRPTAGSGMAIKLFFQSEMNDANIVASRSLYFAKASATAEGKRASGEMGGVKVPRNARTTPIFVWINR